MFYNSHNSAKTAPLLTRSSFTIPLNPDKTHASPPHFLMTKPSQPPFALKTSEPYPLKPYPISDLRTIHDLP
jgi:hypothetical protein